MKTYKTTSKIKALTGSKKSKFLLTLANNATYHTASYWDGGSRGYYSVLNFKNGANRIPGSENYPTFKSETILENDEILIRTGISCGKPSMVHISGKTDQEAEILQFLGNPTLDSKGW